MIGEHKNALPDRLTYNQKIAFLPACEAPFPFLDVLNDPGERMRVLVEHNLKNVETMT